MKVEFLKSFSKDREGLEKKSDKFVLINILALFERKDSINDIPNIK